MSDRLNPIVHQNTTNGIRPKNYLVASILVTVACCMPLGVVGIVYASQVNSKYDVGDFAGAQKASKQAKQFMTWGLIAGILVVVAYMAILGVALILESTN